jgi:hypothetical protein
VDGGEGEEMPSQVCAACGLTTYQPSIKACTWIECKEPLKGPVVEDREPTALAYTYCKKMGDDECKGHKHAPNGSIVIEVSKEVWDEMTEGIDWGDATSAD